MGDTVSDQDTFVSVDNFITTDASHQHGDGDTESGVTDRSGLNPDDFLNDDTGPQGSSSVHDRASFVWTMFNDSVHDFHENDLGGDTMSSRRHSREQPPPDNDDEDSLTDASDVCLEIDDSLHEESERPSQVTVRSVPSPLQAHSEFGLETPVIEDPAVEENHSTRLSLPDGEQHTLLYAEDEGHSAHTDLASYRTEEYESADDNIVQQAEVEINASQGAASTFLPEHHVRGLEASATDHPADAAIEHYEGLAIGSARSTSDKSRVFSRTTASFSGRNRRVSAEQRSAQSYISEDQGLPTHSTFVPNFESSAQGDRESESPAMPQFSEHSVAEESSHAAHKFEDPHTAGSGQGHDNADETEKAFSQDDSAQLFHATSGMTSFQVENPFSATSEDNSGTAARLTLYSKRGGLSAIERSALELFGLNPDSPESVLVGKLVETIVFQKEQMTQYKIAAAELGGSALHSESLRFSELERRRSIAMNALVTELDSERVRMTELSEENEALKEKLRMLEEQQDGVVSYCRQFNPNFSFSPNVESALEGVFAHAQQARRQSALQAEAQNAQLEDLASRVMKLDGLLSESRTRYEEVQTENLQLRRQLSALEGASIEPAQPSPEMPRGSALELNAVTVERDSLLQKLDEQNFQLETLRESLTRANEEKEKVDEALLTLNVDVEMGRSKIKSLQEQRNTAERNCRETDRLRSAEKKRYHEMTQEFTDNIVAAVHDLDAKDVEIRELKREMEDRESVIRSLQVTVSEIEGQLQTLTDAALDKGGSQRRSSGSSRRKVSTVLDTVVRNLRLDLERAQSLLSDKSGELDDLRKKISKQEELMVTLQRECDHYRTIAAVKDRATETFNPHAQMEQQNNFLNRLSEKLGVHSENNHELVGKLVSRVEQLMKDRSLHESNLENMRREVLERERKLHVVRSEMIAEITTLKAEVQHLENLNERANQECRFAEKKLLEVLGERDNSRHDSIGDITSSSLGLRRQSGFDEGDSHSRRESFFSVLGSDNTIQWNDPLVTAAVQSLNDLIEMKENLSSRVRALHEKFDRMMKRGNAVTGNEVRELMIESREIQGDLSGVLDMQQGIIDKLRPDRQIVTQSIPGAEDSLPYMRGNALIDMAESDLSYAHPSQNTEVAEFSRELMARSRINQGKVQHLSSGDEIGEAAGFLRDQLKQTRELYNEKSKANAQLCGVVAELRQELDHLSHEKKATEDLVRELSDNHGAFVARLSEVTGVEESVVAIEDHVRIVIQDLSRLSQELSTKNEGYVELQRRVLKLLAQKRLLAYVIHTYQSKYHLDIMLSTPEEASSAKRRFRISVLTVIACLRIARSSSQMTNSIEEIDVSQDFNVPPAMPLVQRSANGLALVSASVAVAAVPRLEAALVEREKQITELKSAIAALDQVSARGAHDETRASVETSFAYNEDLMNRKDDLARRLRKTMKEKADLEEQYSREKEVRIAAEAKVARYSEKLSMAKKKLSRASAQADSKERTYKAAIKYLKHKADKAVENRVSVDENTAPWPSPQLDQKRDVESERADSQTENAKSLAVLQEQLARSEDNIRSVNAGSSEHDDLSKYIYGLRKAIQRLKHPRRLQSQAPSVVDSNLATEA